MKKLVAIALLASLAGTSAALAVEPIPGSITYGNKSYTRLQKAPVGSPVYHQFYGKDGYDYRETYIIQPDRSLQLSERHIHQVRSN